MIDYSKPIYLRPDGSFRLTFNGMDYHMVKEHPLHAEVADFIKKRPERAEVEPILPGPTPEETAKMMLAALDVKVPRCCETMIKENPKTMKEPCDKNGTTYGDVIAQKEKLRSVL